MALPKTPPYWDQKPLGATHKYREYPQGAKGITSFFVFVFSIFVYISIFYVFNPSPSTFINNNKFWFFISNTLILIIAADYGAFSSSTKNKHDLYYEEYVMHTRRPRSTASVLPKEEEEVENFDEGKNKQVVTDHQKEETQEKVLEIVVQSEPEKIIESYPDHDDDDHHQSKIEKKYRRSKSEKPKRVVIDESKNILRRWDSETKKEEDDGDEETKSVQENNEFSNMSDEELNRRVEEFIQKFNRQIRLQRAGNFQ